MTIQKLCGVPTKLEINPKPCKGSLVFVGTGLQLAGQISVLSRSYIEHAEHVNEIKLLVTQIK